MARASADREIREDAADHRRERDAAMHDGDQQPVDAVAGVR